MKHSRFLKSAAIVSVGGFLAKGLGAVYRIPLTNLLGGYGMGLYQMAYPLFCVLLTFSSAGIPSAFSRIIAREEAASRGHSRTLASALRLFFFIGLCGAFLMLLLAPQMSALQGESELARCYFALAPSVLLVSLIAVFRGYFQGKNDMVPTAVSEIVEQFFKIAPGLYFAGRFAGDPALAASCALVAVSFSELVALGYLVLRCRREVSAPSPFRGVSSEGVLYSALPVMAAASLLPLSQMADSVIIVRFLSRYTSRAVSLYGLYAGGAASLINLPVGVCYGFAAAVVPAVSEAFAEGKEEEGREKAMFALAVTLALSLPCAAGLYLFAPLAVRILYGSLSAADAQILVRLVRIMAVSAALLSCVQTLAACLTGMGKAKYAALAMLVAVAFKLAVQPILLSRPSLSVYGAAIAANACYVIAFSLDLFYTVRRKRKGAKGYDHHCQSGSGKKRLDGAGAGSGASCG